MIPGDRECETALWAAVQRLTRQEIAAGLLHMLADLEQQGQLEPARLEAPGTAALEEAAFRLAREDACLAIAAFEAQPGASSADAAQLLVSVPAKELVQTLVGGPAGAYLRLGEALLAAQGHPDRDAAGAAQGRAPAAPGQRRPGARGVREYQLNVELRLSKPGNLSAPARTALRVALAEMAGCDLRDAVLTGVRRLVAKAGPDGLLAAPPKQELALPYGAYRMVKGDGSAPERTDKHPFCMSRVFYDAAERPEELWAQLADGSCRWRQSGSEVKVVALRVPRKVPPRALAVTLDPYLIRVAHQATGEVYLEGELERGIVPDESVWMQGGGEGEDGCLLLLRKMNFELLRQHWLHSESWWPRLLRGQPAVAWDDYEKDYSDLPSEVLAQHAAVEAVRSDVRRLEARERDMREVLQERDDLRKRTRQERLRQMRFGQTSEAEAATASTFLHAASLGPCVMPHCARDTTEV
ncbi:hypothetical protein WJX81_003624 [Elliptochloris bilobata]|uniref:CS domain-containing protein n=1 Tax=Elliptochloris bilobata TaxID=381761 RepID=A0AAW1RUH1_9CHLO